MFVAFSVGSQVASAAYTLCLEKDWLIAIASNESELTGRLKFYELRV